MQEQEIENIRKTANIVDIISSYVDLTPKGKNYFGVCPFHEDHSPSMSVSEDKQIYKCFSCGAAGNVFTFVKDYENVSFLEAVSIVAQKCGLTFNVVKKTTNKTTNHQKEYEIMELALKFYQNNLNTKEGNKAKEYLKTRKLDESVIKDFDLGLALDKDYALNKLLLSKNYKLEDLLELGLVNRNNEYLNDVFNKRIIFPIHDLEGHPVGFTGRIYDDSNQAKYINSKESPIFKKGEILFNYHRSKSEIKKKKEVIIVEGNMDAIRLYSMGVKNVVALMGTSLTKEQVEIIKNLRAKIILMLDNDSAGEIATYNNGNILSENNLTPYVVRLSGEKDPDEYVIKNGIDAIINNIANPISFLEFKLKYLKKDKDLTKTEDLVSYIKEVIKSLESIPDELTRNITLKRISTDYDIPLEMLQEELKKVNILKKPLKTPKILEKNPKTKYDIACMNIIYFMMHDYIYITRFKKELGYFTNKIYRDIANAIIYYYETHNAINIADFLSYAEEENINSSVKEIMTRIKDLELNMDNFEEFIFVAKKEMEKEQIKELKAKIASELDEAKKLELANKLIEIKKGCVGNE